MDNLSALKKENALLKQRIKKLENQNHNNTIYEAYNSIVPAAIFTTNTNKIITSWNKYAEHITHYTANEVVGKSCLEIMSSPCNENCAIYNTNTIKPIENITCNFTRKDGTIIKIRKNTDVIKDNTGKIIGSIESFVDITNYLNQQLQIKTAEENFRTFFNSINDFLFVLNMQGEIININDTVTNRLGYTKEELYGKNILIVHPENRRQEAGKIIQDMLINKAEFCPIPLQTKSGNLIEVETRVYMGKWDGKPALYGVTKDITKIKQYEERFVSAFESSTSLMAISEVESGKFINVNDAFLQITGFERSDVIGLTAKEIDIFYDYNDRDKILKIFKQNGIVKNVEVKIKTKDNDYKVGLFSVNKLNIDQIPCWLTTMIDITERKKIEEINKLNQKKLKQLNNEIEGILNHLPALIYYKDLNGKFIRVNNYLAQAHKLTKDEMEGKSVYDIFHSELAEKYLQDDKEIIQTQKPKLNIIEPWQVENEKRWVQTSKIPFYNKNNDLTGVIGMSIDITTMVKIEEKLKISKERYDLAVSGTNDGIWDWDLKTNDLFLSPQWKKQLGYNDDELPNDFSTFENNLHEDDLTRVMNSVQDYLSEKKDKYLEEFRMWHKNGKVVWILARGKALRDNKGVPYRMAGSHTDITERKKSELELIKAKEIAEKNERDLKHSQSLAKMGSWDFDVQTGIFTFNDNFFKIYRTSVKEVGSYQITPEDYVSKFVYQNDAGVVATEIKKALETDDPNFSNYIEHRIVYNDGTVGHIGVKYFIQKDKTGKTISIHGVNQDITERKEAEFKILENEKKFRLLFEKSPLGKYIASTDGKIIDANETLIKMLGSPSIEATKQINVLKFPPLVQNDYAAIFKSVIKTKQTKQIELKYTSKWGKAMYLSSYIVPLINNNNEVYQVYTLMEDITKEKEAQTKLLESEEKFKAIINQFSEGLYILDAIGNIVEWNKMQEQLTGILRENAIGKPVLEVFSIFSKKQIRIKNIENFVDILKTKEFINEKGGYQTEVDTPIGKQHIIHQYFPVKTNKKQYLANVIHNITKRVQNEDLIRKLSIAVEQSPAIIVITDLEGKVEYVNQKFVELTGYKSSEILGQKTNILKSGYLSDNVYKELWQTIVVGKTWHGEFQNKKKNGELYWELASITAIKKNSGEKTHYLKISEDITERKQFEIQLSNAKEEAEKANQSKSEFLANMSHEIRTPLNAIIGFSEVLYEELNDYKFKTYSKSIQNSGQTLLRLINDILDLSKIEAGKLNITKDYMQTQNIVSHIYQVFDLRAKQKQINLVVDTDSNIPKVLYTDELRLRQILLNVVGNAIKFTDKGSVEVFFASENNHITNKTTDIKITVSDTGIGIPLDKQEMIFESFAQQDIQTSRKYGGTGLGLSITKRLVEMLNGTIQLQSEPQKGSIFTIILKDIYYSNELKASKKLIDKQIELYEANIAIVDDMESNRVVLEQYLRTYPINIFSISDGFSAIELIKSTKINVMLLDMRMPGMSGYETARQIKKIAPKIKIIAVSASDTNNNENLFDQVLKKPIYKQDLITALAKYIGKTSRIKSDNTEKVIDITSIKNIKQLLYLLDEKIIPRLENVKASGDLTEIEKFARILIKLANYHNFEEMKQLGNNMLAAVESIDIEMLSKYYMALQQINDELHTKIN